MADDKKLSGQLVFLNASGKVQPLKYSLFERLVRWVGQRLSIGFLSLYHEKLLIGRCVKIFDGEAWVTIEMSNWKEERHG